MQAPDLLEIRSNRHGEIELTIAGERITFVLVVIDVARITAENQRRGYSAREIADDIDALLTHELLVHAGSAAEGGWQPSTVCSDPNPAELVHDPDALGCSTLEENRIRAELGLIARRSWARDPGLHATRDSLELNVAARP